MLNKKALLYNISKISIILAVFLAFGTVGALECDNIGFTQTFIQLLIAAGMGAPYMIVNIIKHLQQKDSIFSR